MDGWMEGGRKLVMDRGSVQEREQGIIQKQWQIKNKTKNQQDAKLMDSYQLSCLLDQLSTCVRNDSCHFH